LSAHGDHTVIAVSANKHSLLHRILTFTFFYEHRVLVDSGLSHFQLSQLQDIFETVQGNKNDSCVLRGEQITQRRDAVVFNKVPDAE